MIGTESTFLVLPKRACRAVRRLHSDLERGKALPGCSALSQHLCDRDLELFHRSPTTAYTAAQPVRSGLELVERRQIVQAMLATSGWSGPKAFSYIASDRL